MTALKEAVWTAAAYAEDPIVKMLAEMPAESWTAKQQRYLYSALAKHSDLLKSSGLDYDAIDDPSTCAELPASPYSIRLDGNRFLVRFPGRSDPPDALTRDIRQIPKCKRDHDQDAYSVPARMLPTEYLHSFLNATKKRLGLFDVSPEAAQMMSYILSEAQGRYEASMIVDASEGFDMQGFGLPTFPYQRGAIEGALRFKRGWFADSMGLGKTREDLGTIWLAKAYPAVIVTPASVLLNWAREATQGLVNKRIWIAKNRKAPEHKCERSQLVLLNKPYDPKCNGCQFEHADIILLNYDKVGMGWVNDKGELVRANSRTGSETLQLSELAEAIIERNPASVNMDESHYLKASDTLRSGALLKVVTAAKPERIYAISGTAVRNRADEIIAQARILQRLDDLGGYTHIKQVFCALPKKGLSGKTEYKGSRNEQQLNATLRKIGYIRREKEDPRIGLEMPPLTSSMLTVEITNRNEYERAEEDIISWASEQAEKRLRLEAELTGAGIDQEKIIKARIRAEKRAMAGEAMVRMAALQRITGQGKLKAAEEWIEDFRQHDRKLVTFAFHVEIQQHLANKFKMLTILGADSLKNRDKAMQIFQGAQPNDTDEDGNLIMVSFSAGKEGLNLQAASELLITQFGSWVPADYDQIVGRCHRVGSIWPVTAYYLLGANTIDELIYRVLAQKRVVVDAINKGDPEKQSEHLIFELLDELAAMANSRKERIA